MGLTVTIENREKGTCMIVPDGRLDAATTPAFEEKINPLLVPPVKNVILNLEKLAYLSSAGIRVIFKIRKTLAANGKSFVITNVQPQIRKVFEIINALPETPIFTSIEEVDRYLDAIQKKEMENQKQSPEA
jgi:anti-anti-sigma factor